MDKAGALESLTSEDMGVRLAAARALVSTASPSDRQTLELRRRSEPVPWVRNALERALIALSVRQATATVETITDAVAPEEIERSEEAIYASAIQEVSGRLVHELRKVVGRVRFFAADELKSIENSRTIANLDRLQQLLDGVKSLGDAASVAAEVELDLAALVDGEIEDCGAHLEVVVRVDALGPRPSLVIGDPALIRLVVANGLKNAVEAVAEAASHASVVVTWGTTDVDYWLAILDRGPGVPTAADALFEIGETTKRGHSGMGLAVARRAARSLAGELVLENDGDGMTRYEFRWPKRALR